MDRRQWSKAVERLTCARRPPNEKEARRCYAQLDAAEQTSLVRELVETRGAELCRAYRDAIDVWYGYKLRRTKRGTRRIERTPSLKFLVKKKAGKARPPTAGQRIPRAVFAYWTVKGRRALCAVPTDVECATDYYRVRAQSVGRVIVTDPAVPGELGAVACKVVVSRPGSADRVYALSCRHVFGYTRRFHPHVVPGLAVVTESRDAVATTNGLYGQLRDHAGPPSRAFSFDAQLATIVDMARLDALFARVRINRTARGIDDVPDEYFIHTPRGLTLRANRLSPREHPPLIPYDTAAGVISVLHELLIESQVPAGTIGGDSGSPVVTQQGVLVGMHIAGGGDLAYMIPAWHLFQPRRYKGLSSVTDTMVLG